MGAQLNIGAGTEAYGQLRAQAWSACREGAPAFTEQMLQSLWHAQAFAQDNLRTEEGHTLEVVSPGWWNRQDGPDFQGAQIRFNGQLHNGDVELHLEHAGWRAHGHHTDKRYDRVILHVVYDGKSGAAPAATSEGRQVPTLRLAALIRGNLDVTLDALESEEAQPPFGTERGRCASIHEARGTAELQRFLELAGDWRILHKARELGARMDQAGGDQSVYETVLYACGYSQFKQQFRALARALPYERARQLAQRDPLVLETALLQVAGLLPEVHADDAGALPHLERLQTLRREGLDGLRSLPLAWNRVGVRPTNNPERRIAGVARFVARTAQPGLLEGIMRVWHEAETPLAQRRAFEALFPRPMGFWAQHCTWTGKPMARPSALVGGGRVRSIIGNVFVPAALAVARRERDRTLEERIFAFFATLPKEENNHIIRRMLPRVLGVTKAPKLNFRLQQGLLQMYLDWCEPNPSCRNCRALGYLDKVPAAQSAADEVGERCP